MQPKLSLKTLIEDSLNGNFNNVYKTINSKGVQLHTASAVKVIVAVCNACHKNFSSPAKLIEEDLVRLVRLLLKFIHVPTNENYENYIQSVFYILKLLIEKKRYDLITELDNVLMPEFMPLVLTPKQISVYQSTAMTLYNVVVKIVQSKDKTSLESASKLSFLVALLYKKIGNKVSLLETAHNCALGLVSLKYASKKLSDLYSQILSLFEPPEDLKLYPLFINNFSFLYTYFLKNENFDLASTCYQFTQNKLDQIYKKNSEYSLLKRIFNVVEWINPGDQDVSISVPNEGHAALKTYFNGFKSTENLQSICDLISSVAFTALQFYKTRPEKWSQSIQTHVDFYKFLNDVSLIMAKTTYSCHCKKCSTRTNLNEALRTLNTIGGLGRLSIMNGEVSRNYKIDTFRYLEKIVDYLSVLKENRCEKWQKYWYDLGVHLYSIGVHLNNKKDTEMANLYLQKFVQIFFDLEGMESTNNIIDQNYIVASLNLIADSYFDSKDYEKCLLTTSLSLVVTKNPKNEINRWIRTKVASRENTIDDTNDIQNLTLVSVLTKFKSDLALYLPKVELKLSTERKIDLLEYELKQYFKKWRSKVPMASVFRELASLAKSEKVAEVFVEIWGEADLAVHETVSKMLQDTILRVEIEKIENKDLILAHLYFLQHKYCMQDVIVKHCDEMERTMNITKARDDLNRVPDSDPNDNCDLFSSYESLKLSRYVKMIKGLDKALDLIFDWLNKNTVEDRKIIDRLYKLLANIGHEFSLHLNMVKSLQAWELAYKISDSKSMPLQKLQAIAFIIEHSDVRKGLIKKLITESECLVKILKNHDNFKENIEGLVVYHLCKAEAFLYVDVDEAYKAFSEAVELSQKSKISDILQAKILLVEHKFIMLPCQFEVQGHKEFSLVRIHQANNSANTYYNKTAGTSSYDMRIFFEIYETLAKMYHDLRLPREVRCYAKDAIIIAQKMVLPLRTISFLYYLSYADINTCRLDDCREKMKDFSDILGLTKGQKFINGNFQMRSDKEKMDEVDSIVQDLNEMMLDVPKKVQIRSCGSPTFDAEPFKLPLFLAHEDSCECFYCTCVEYHQFVLKNTYLSALLYEHQNNLSVAKEFFCGCIKIYEFLKSKQEVYTRKINKKISADLVPKPKNRIAETYCLTLLEYANFSIRKGRLTDAKNINTKVINVLDSFGLQFVYLLNEDLVQKLDILALISPLEQPEIKQNPVSVPDFGTMLKTPQSKQSKVLISPEILNTGFVESYKILPKSIKFDLYDSEDESEDVTKKNTRSKNFTPLLDFKTPAASSSSKPKMYTDKKKSSAKILTELQFKVPERGGEGRIDPNLATRTKLLTERLKNSSRKVKKDENLETLTKGVRQNLLKQLNDAEDLERGGTVRKSTRNRK